MSIFNLSVITHKQCIPCVAQSQHVSYLQNFLRHKGLATHVFCKLGRELYCTFSAM